MSEIRKAAIITGGGTGMGAATAIRLVQDGWSVTIFGRRLGKLEEMMAKIKNRMPLGRAAKPEEIAAPIAFLLSDDASFITGAILPVDGGVMASNGQPNFLG